MFGRKDTQPQLGENEPGTLVEDPFSQDTDSVFEKAKDRTLRKVIATIDAPALLRMSLKDSAAELSKQVRQILADERMHISGSEEARMIEEINDQILGFGPLERFLVRDDISDIMVNGAEDIFIEVDGRIERSDITFRDNEQLLNVCQRIVSLVGRRVDQSSPICDARLKDGSRVNVIIPPLAVDAPSLTIRRFRKQKFTLDDFSRIGTISPAGAEVLRILSRSRCNLLVVGGTGSGKTTLLNVIANQIEDDERIVSCEDTAELQLGHSNLVRLETRPPNIEGEGEVKMRDLVKNCLRMRPDRIIVGEVRGPEAFDLLQAMNTGHDGSMGTLHANSAQEALSRLEAMITMGYEGLNRRTIREMIGTAVDVVVHVSRLRDGSRKIMAISELVYQTGEEIELIDLFRFEVEKGAETGEVVGTFKSAKAATQRKPEFWQKLIFFEEQDNFLAALKEAQT
ncbi:CpaF family protein [Lutimaribacter sp. EGI FJ00015]|uniref:CpaF family protein n=1 Tax=Lutimaribacter degradans TaxID=2945989 RepID=A0ACC6A034_9RHOB|nr:CpaF family protein [Lutimaribacter sp. EGI FJ00013]MCM2563361.1 CpaF family protein [Lutimaribacter sp. EGI FJ00013]MCO0614561.1 CpaF family protein [Lutimaribacter sp. EGI FJ00015]MCO0637233.1 CpaF family protein [Lutimaribacter sp. EGI FJ00014]